MRAMGVIVFSIGVSWGSVASAQVAAVKGETDSTTVVIGVLGKHNATTGAQPGVQGQSPSTDPDASGVKGVSSATTPGFYTAGVLGVSLGSGTGGIGVYGFRDGSGHGVFGETTSGGTGVGGFSDTGFGVRGDTLDGQAVVGTASGASTSSVAVEGANFGVGRGGRFAVQNAASSATGLTGETSGTGTALLAQHLGASGNIAIFQSGLVNKARIDKNGVGYFNGGTVASGADLAEAFDVEGDRDGYEPGDVLAISTRSDRTLEKSSAPSSPLVAGVYATKPGVLLTDLDVDADAAHRVPLGVVGVIPTKVSAENGAIRRGDLLVTAATPGHAMKAATPQIIGTVLGKALQDFAGPGTGIINVLVNVQ